MKIILLRDSGKIGKQGDIVVVKDGYARNFLIPGGAALRATAENSKKLKEIKRHRAKIVDKKKQEFLKLKDKIDKLSLTITAEAKNDQDLYGAVGEGQIIKLLAQENIPIDKNSVILDQPIKKLGVYTIKIDLYPQIEASLRLWVMKK